ncbi:hypothetical protein D3C85_986360 [compost metagenome]
MGVQFVGAGEELARVHCLQARAELLLGQRCFFAFALLVGLDLSGGSCQLEGDALLLGRARQFRQIDLGANTGHVVLRAHGQLAVLVATFLGQRAIGLILTPLKRLVCHAQALESSAVAAREGALHRVRVCPSTHEGGTVLGAVDASADSLVIHKLAHEPISIGMQDV